MNSKCCVQLYGFTSVPVPMTRMENHNRLAHKLLIAHNHNTSNAIGLKLTWTLSKGRNFKGIDRDTNSLKDTETGVAK